MSTPSIDEIATAQVALDQWEQEIVERQAGRYGPRDYDHDDAHRERMLAAWRLDAATLDRIEDSRRALAGMLR